MKIEIDQSNKVEQTSKTTFISFSNGEHFTVSIPAEVKRKLQEEFRTQGKPLLFVRRTFIAGVVLLLRYGKIHRDDEVIIDQEYYGHEKTLKSMFAEMWTRFSDDVPEIDFQRIGKKSRAHEVVYSTMKGIYKPNRVLTFGEIKRLVLK
jgi:hypothetical protein